MNQELSIKIILENPTKGVDFGIQKGSGSKYETIQKQRSELQDLNFEFNINAKTTKDSIPDFSGPIVQGNKNERFIYIDIGKCAGQLDTFWSRRLKIPLKGITIEMINQLLTNSSLVLETKIPGTGKDFGPNCGTVKPFSGWQVIKKY